MKNSFFSFFFPKIIHKETSLINGEIEVVEQFGQRSIRVENLEQSGLMVEKIWSKGIENCKLKIENSKNILILGLGGGSAVKVIFFSFLHLLNISSFSSVYFLSISSPFFFICLDHFLASYFLLFL